MCRRRRKGVSVAGWGGVACDEVMKVWLAV